MKPNASILVVDDEPRLLDGIRLTLETAGYEVLAVPDGLKALAALQSQPVDLIVADIAMPRMNGYQLYKRVRENSQWISIPFIFLTARAMDSDIRYGKELGADDYLTKPFEPEDLLAVIHGKLRRAQQLARRAAPPPATASHPLTIGKLRIDPGQYRVWMGEEPVELSAREFTLLESLARQAKQVISPQTLIQTTHDLDTDHTEASSLLRPLIRTLRRKLGYPVGDMGCIENVRGVGYRLVPPDD
ncbi:MAG: response regulator transcription factor [Chloroflexota bacterium]|nr:response regulator transcription factor [Chloroflexota bacterium]